MRRSFRRRHARKVAIFLSDLVGLIITFFPVMLMILLGAPTWAWFMGGLIIWYFIARAIFRELESDNELGGYLRK